MRRPRKESLGEGEDVAWDTRPGARIDSDPGHALRATETPRWARRRSPPHLPSVGPTANQRRVRPYDEIAPLVLRETLALPKLGRVGAGKRRIR